VLADLARRPWPDPAAFEAVLVGGSVYGGKVQPRVTAFCEAHEAALRGRPSGVFLCCLSRGSHAESQMEDSFPRWLLEAAVIRSLPGGRLAPSRLTILDRLLVRSVPRPPGEVDQLDSPEIARLAAAMTAAVSR
jgi:menaquinone-dependent protoporphyrinogen oxidase